MVDGEPPPLVDALSPIKSWRETARSATSGGLLTVIEKAKALEKVQSDPAQIKTILEG